MTILRDNLHGRFYSVCWAPVKKQVEMGIKSKFRPLRKEKSAPTTKSPTRLWQDLSCPKNLVKLLDPFADQTIYKHNNSKPEKILMHYQHETS